MFTIRTFVAAAGVTVAAGAAVLMWRRLRRQRRGCGNTSTSASPFCGQRMNEVPHTSAERTNSLAVDDDSLQLNGLPTDSTNDAQLCKESSPVTDNGSEKTLQFFIPRSLCGPLIGKKGRTVNRLKAKSGASIHVEASPTAEERHLCVVKGDDDAINRAVDAIIEMFPELKLELRPQSLVSETVTPVVGEFRPVKFQLIPQSEVSVLLASILGSTRVFVHLPTEPTFAWLDKLTSSLGAACTGALPGGLLPPPLDEPVKSGMLCAVESNGAWYRGQIVQPYVQCAHDDGANSSYMQLCYVDYGTYEAVPCSRIRKLRMEFLTMPFQAIECVLANVDPPQDSLGESIAITTLSSFANRPLECVCVGQHNVTGVPLIELYAINNGEVVHVNKLISDSRGIEWLTNGSA